MPKPGLSGDAIRQALTRFGRGLCQCGQLMVGIPDYDNYVSHVKVTHPDRAPMTHEQFLRDRVDARYGGGGKQGSRGFKCC